MTVLFACLGYLLGSIPTGVIVGRLVLGQDVRSVGSGNIGASNVARAGGMRVGLMVAVLDMLKGVIAVMVGRWAGLDPAGLALVGLAAVAGHDFSIFLRFRGGKGVATTLGVALALAPIAAALALVCWLLTFTLRYASLASLVALASLPVFMWLTGQPSAYVLLMGGLFLLAVARLWENIVRLLSGTERRFGRKAGDAG